MSMRALGCVLAAGTLLIAAEKKVKKSDLPAPVQQAAEKASQGAQVVGYSKEVENGQTLYEMESKVNGRTKDISFDEKGNIVAVEEEVAMDSLPDAVQEGLRKAAGKGQITKVESVTKGHVVTYEAQVKGGAKKEVVVDGKGNPR
jgi:hypothetical protein